MDEDEIGDWGDTFKELVSAGGKAAIAARYSRQQSAAAPMAASPVATAATVSKTGMSDSTYAIIGVAAIGVVVLLVARFAR